MAGDNPFEQQSIQAQEKQSLTSDVRDEAKSQLNSVNNAVKGTSYNTLVVIIRIINVICGLTLFSISGILVLLLNFGVVNITKPGNTNINTYCRFELGSCIMSLYMVGFGALLIFYEVGSKSQKSFRFLKRYFGLIFFYMRRVILLTFLGGLSCGVHCSRIGFIGGIACFLNALLHFWFKKAHPDFDEKFTLQMRASYTSLPTDHDRPGIGEGSNDANPFSAQQQDSNPFGESSYTRAISQEFNQSPYYDDKSSTRSENPFDSMPTNSNPFEQDPNKI